MTLHIPLIKLPLLLHLLTEIPACLSFLLVPEAQLPRATPEATLILRNFGGLLLSTNLIALLFILRSHFDCLSALVTLCLGAYHIWPIYRAYSRLRDAKLAQGKKENEKQNKVLGGPVVHFWVHIGCLAALLLSGWYGLG
ncbi:hypothetical protein QBC36DRAFT_300807 [Triangularia setosa]|uniref:Uncharacterized protein n=1 Tax=Triangularia setosa TaxID=2587417 RepID=A0AAN7A695_9PEZI|nr:hypothetical protein QBC36DRAFT_300807 [Podospora setosa]